MRQVTPELVVLGALLSASPPALPQERTPAQEQTPDANAAGGAAPAVAPPLFSPLTPAGKIERRALRLVEPPTLFTSALSAGFGQLRNKPPEWGQGAEGFGRRFGYAEAFNAAHNGVALTFDLALHLDPRYRRMPHAGIKPRLRNAVTQTFVTRTDCGGSRVNVSEIAASFGAGLIANAWEPPGSNGIGDGLTRGALGLVYHTLKNFALEFLPDILHRDR